MWSRVDLKMRGKTAFYRNYWIVVLVALIVTLAAGSAGSNSNSVRRTYNNVKDNQNYSGFYDDYDYNDSSYNSRSYSSHVGTAIASVIFSVVFVTMAIIILLLKLLIGNNILVGGNRFFMENREHRTRAGTVFYSFKNGRYGNVLLTMFLMDLYIFLWSLLLIVPGIIKSYEYRMVPYILSENPGMDRRRAFDLSRQMMSGQKMDTFILDLSFIGWAMLSVLTCGILDIFFLSPYIYTTQAELYAVLRSHALQSGMTNTNELPGYSYGYDYGYN